MPVLVERHPHAYRTDETVPPFDDSAPIAFVDGNCALCSTSARLISRFDTSGTVRICPTQSQLGNAVLSHFGLDADDPTTWLYLEDGKASTSLHAVLQIGRHLGVLGWILAPLRLLPRVLQDRLYIWIARNRYRLFGHEDLCSLPDARLRARLME